MIPFHSYIRRVLGFLIVCTILVSTIARFQPLSLADTPTNPSDVSAPSAVTTDSATNRVSIPFVVSESRPLQLEENPWPMLAANPQRTSWTPEEVRGALDPAWYRPIEPYIPAKVQIIAAYGLLYVSTANGLYALNAEDGRIAWVYPTEMPLGHSPTVYSGAVYVGGFDKRIHALEATPDVNGLPVDAETGYRINNHVLWTFEAEAGFDTNPLVIEDKLFAGNRDGSMYAIYISGPQTGRLAWRFQTDGPIHFSAAYQDGIVYFASNDAYAYALQADTGELVWKSAKLPVGNGFHSWWPVITGSTVVLASSRSYRVGVPPQTGAGSLFLSKHDDGYWPPAEAMGPVLPDGSMDATRAMQYLEEKPWRRSYYLLDLNSGLEITYDLDTDGNPEYAPLMWTGTNSGNRYPPAIGSDGKLYTFNLYSASGYGNGMSAWQLGASSITPVGSVTAPDEPLAYSIGGNVIYYTHCCDRSAGGIEISGSGRWFYIRYNLATLCSGYNVMTAGTAEDNLAQVYGGWNGVYGSHGDQNAPIPYRGKLYLHRGNAIIALSAEGGAMSLPLAKSIAVMSTPESVTRSALEQKLVVEIQKILDAGHLRPGFDVSFGQVGKVLGDKMGDVWHNPADTIYTLVVALPHLPSDMQDELRAYIQNEFVNYPPYEYTHIGWRDGAERDDFVRPPEIAEDLPNYGPNKYSSMGFDGWTGPDWKWTPYTFYALWKYAEAFGGARDIFDKSRHLLWTPPSDEVLKEYPFAHNAWISGYWGYLELEKLAGYPESADKRVELDRLLALRVANFEKDNPWGPDDGNPEQAFSIARNFTWLTPELGQYLRDHALGQMQEAVDEYTEVAPYWFVTRFEATFREYVIHHLYDYNALFAAKAYIFQEPAEELVKYIDVPAFARGDLFYIQNLVSAIEAAEQVTGSVTLHQDWNLISLPVAPVSSAITDTLSTIAGKYDQACVYNRSGATGTWVCYCPLDPTPDASQIALDQTHGIWIHATQPVTLTMQGSLTDPTSISLRSGWNMVGYPSRSARPVQEALASIQGKYDLVYAYDPLEVAKPWKTYQPDRMPAINNLTQMIPGQGYWLKVNQDCIWVVPT